MPLACISVDLDSLHHYCRIYGMAESVLDGRARALIYEAAVPRFLDLFAELAVPGTFFAIGEDLGDESAKAALRKAHAAGVEIANHTFHHDYALTRRTPEAIADDVRRGAEAIREAIGTAQVGFRAPGYTLNGPLYRALEQDGYLYDSSTFPAAPYYAVKATVMGALAAIGRPSRAILDSPRVLTAPRVPYWPDRLAPYRRGDGSVLEIPIATSAARVPFYGTLAVSLGAALVRPLYLGARGTPLLNFELHAVDILGAGDGIPSELVSHQRDLGIEREVKGSRLRDVFRWIKADFEVVTLADGARRIGAQGAPLV
jgi:peptidoglycan-N-acetylglucosamine deacetylase